MCMVRKFFSELLTARDSVKKSGRISSHGPDTVVMVVRSVSRRFRFRISLCRVTLNAPSWLFRSLGSGRDSSCWVCFAEHRLFQFAAQHESAARAAPSVALVSPAGGRIAESKRKPQHNAVAGPTAGGRGQGIAPNERGRRGRGMGASRIKFPAVHLPHLRA